MHDLRGFMISGYGETEDSESDSLSCISLLACLISYLISFTYLLYFSSFSSDYFILSSAASFYSLSSLSLASRDFIC